jgi:hypothetical protein
MSCGEKDMLSMKEGAANVTTAFENYTMDKCEEILTEDKEYCELHRQAFKAEHEFLKLLSVEQRKAYMNYESILFKMNSYAQVAICKTLLSKLLE